MGTLTLKTQVATVDDLRIKEGSTLVVDVDDALPALDGRGSTLVEIPKGNLVVSMRGTSATPSRSCTWMTAT